MHHWRFKLAGTLLGLLIDTLLNQLITTAREMDSLKDKGSLIRDSKVTWVLAFIII